MMSLIPQYYFIIQGMLGLFFTAGTFSKALTHRYSHLYFFPKKNQCQSASFLEGSDFN